MRYFKSTVLALACLSLTQACDCGGGTVPVGSDASLGADASQTVDAANTDAVQAGDAASEDGRRGDAAGSDGAAQPEDAAAVDVQPSQDAGARADDASLGDTSLGDTSLGDSGVDQDAAQVLDAAGLDAGGGPGDAARPIDAGAQADAASADAQPPQGAPTANAQSLATDEDQSLDITLTGSDPDGDALTYHVVDGPAHGSLSGTPPQVTYTPDADFFGSDSFGFGVNDGLRDSAVASVIIDVRPVQDAPVASPDSYRLDEDSVLTVDASGGVLANDVDVDGDVLQSSVVQPPVSGALQHSSDGSFSFDARGAFDALKAGESAQLTWSYSASDGVSPPSTATVTLTIDGRNDAPLVADESYVTDEDSALNVAAAAGVLANDSDVEGDALSASLVTLPAQGSLSLMVSGAFRFDPAGAFETLRAGESQQLGFVYQVSDGQGGQTQGNASITVNGVNDLPIAVADSYSTIGNTAIVVDAASGLLANDSDPETAHANLRAAAETKASSAGGDVIIGSDGSFTYAPPLGVRSQIDSFTYTLDDGDGGQVQGSVTVSIGADLVWYVDNSGTAPGDGRSNTPFVRLKSAEVSSLSGDTIRLRSGDGTSAGSNEGIVLKAGQRLIGSGVDLVFAGRVIEAAAQRALVANTAGHAITLADGVRIEGLDIDFASGDGLHGLGLSQAMTVGDIRIANTDGHGLWLHNSSAALAMGAVSIVGTGAASSLGNGIDLFSNTSALSLASLSIVTDNGGGLVTFGGGSVDIAVATTSIDATGGPAVDIGNTQGWVAGVRGWRFADLSSTNSASWGLRIVNQMGSGSFTLSGSLSVVNPQSEALFVGTVGTPVDLASVALQAPSGYGVYATSASDLRIRAGSISNVAGSGSAGGIHLINSTVDLKLSSVSVGAAAEGLYASGGGGSVVLDSFTYSGGLGRAVDLINSDLALTLTAGSITTPAGGAIYVSGGAPTLNVATDISVDAGYLLSVADTTAGSSVTVINNSSFSVTGGSGVQVRNALGSLHLGLAYYSGVSNGAGAVVDISGTCGTLDFSDLQIDTSLDKAVQARSFGGSLSLRGAMLRAAQRTVDVTFTGGGSLLVSGTISRRFGAEALSVLLDTGSPVSFDLANNIIELTSLNAASTGIVLRTGAGAAGEFRGNITGNSMSFVGEAIKVISDGADVVITDPLLSNSYQTNGVPPVVLRGVNGGRVSLDADLSTTALDTIVYDAWSVGTDVANRATVLPFEYQNIAGTLHFATSLAAYTDGIPALQIDGVSAAELTLRSDTGVLDTLGAAGLVISDATLDMQLSSLAVDGNGVAPTSLQLSQTAGRLRVDDVVDLSNTTGACLDVRDVGADIDLAYSSSGSVSVAGCGGPAVDLSGNSKASTVLGLGVSSLDSASLPILRLANNTGGTVQTRAVTLANPGGLSGAQVKIDCSSSTPGIDSAASYQFDALRLTHALNGGLRITDSAASTTFGQLQITATGGTALFATSGGAANAITVPAGGGSFIDIANGTAIYVSGAQMDMHLQSVSASNSAQGIFFWMGGLLEVTGDAAGTAGSGGRISLISGDGVSVSNALITLRHMSFIDTASSDGTDCQDPLTGSVFDCHAAIHLTNGSNPVFDDLLIEGSNQDGIILDEVYGSTLSNITIRGVGNASHETAIALVDCANTHSLSNMTVGVGSGGGQFNQRNLVVSQQSRNDLTLNVTNSGFSSATGDSVRLRTASTHQITASFDGSGMDDNRGSALVVETYDTSSASVSLFYISMTNNNIVPSPEATLVGRNYDDSSLSISVDLSSLESQYTARSISLTQPYDGAAAGLNSPQLRLSLTNSAVLAIANTVISGPGVEISGDNRGRVWSLIERNNFTHYWAQGSALWVSARGDSRVDTTLRNSHAIVDLAAGDAGVWLQGANSATHCLNLGVAGSPNLLRLEAPTGKDALHIDKSGGGAFLLDGLPVAADGSPFTASYAWAADRAESDQTTISAVAGSFTTGTCELP